MRKTVLVFVVIGVVMVAGCAGNLDPKKIAKGAKMVKDFMDNHPNASLGASLVKDADIRSECKNQQLEVKDYWKVVAEDSDSNTKVTAWIDLGKQEVVCVYLG